jgi:hypothetical protein
MVIIVKLLKLTLSRREAVAKLQRLDGGGSAVKLGKSEEMFYRIAGGEEVAGVTGEGEAFAVLLGLVGDDGADGREW